MVFIKSNVLLIFAIASINLVACTSRDVRCSLSDQTGFERFEPSEALVREVIAGSPDLSRRTIESASSAVWLKDANDRIAICIPSADSTIGRCGEVVHYYLRTARGWQALRSELIQCHEARQ